MSLTKTLWLCALLFPVLIYVGGTMCVWSQPRPLGEVSSFFLFLWPVFALPFCAAVPAIPCFLAVGMLQRHGEGQLVQASSRAAACVCYLVLSFVAVLASHRVRHDAFVGAERVGNQVVDALSSYQKDKGHYPTRLDELVPGYLAEIPYTGLIGYPRFNYRPGYRDVEPQSDLYELRIFCPSGGINFDRFIYWPTESYPERIQGNGVEPIGRWAYVHE